ncbi:MAG: FxLYD domain-containing protein [Methanobacteriaceae archaeon]|nr:FxLYD domain-containing protein [Methanobacteriaceae archaeon]
MIISLALIFVAGCSDNGTDYEEGNVKPASEQVTEQEATEEVQPLLVINDHSLGKEEYGGYIVTGSATANKDLSYAEVKVKYYDEGGALVGSDYTNIVDIAAGETWNFKVYGPSDDSIHVSDYKIAVGDCSEAY